MTAPRNSSNPIHAALGPRVIEAAAGRWNEIHAYFGIPSDFLVHSKSGMPCPFAGCPEGPGTDRYSIFHDYERSGGVYCRKCHNGETEPRCGSGVAALARFLGISYGEAARQIADHLGLIATSADQSYQPQGPSIIERVAVDRRMPLEPFLQFEPKEATRGRGKLSVARVPVYNERGEKHSHFDLAPGQKGWFARGTGMSGLFFPGRLPQPGETWLLPEGIKDAAALIGLGYNACGLPTNYLAPKYARLFTGVEVIVVPDLDSAGAAGAQKTAGDLYGIATSVHIARLPGQHVVSGGDDIRDCIRKHGEGAIRDSISAAELWTPPNSESVGEASSPKILLTLDYASHVDEVVTCLGQLGWSSPWIPEEKRESRKLYQRGGLLTEVVDEVRADPTAIDGKVKAARIRSLPLQQIPLRVADACRLFIEKETEGGIVEQPIPPPRWLVDGVHTAGTYGEAIRLLDGVVTAPTLRTDGSVLQSPGWDSQTGLLFRPSMAFAPVPEEPTQTLAQQATKTLLKVVSDFPFSEPADQAAWLAMLLSMIGRPCVVGNVPLFAVTANIRGAGKSMLVDVASLIAFGHAAARTTYAADDDEMRKRITAEAIAGTPAILLDNIDRPIGGASLDAALTAARWKDRELGQSRVVDLPLRAVWAATGNNLSFRSDVARRVIPIRLDSRHERPEERTDFEQDDLLTWVRQDRARLVTAALTILRGYFVAGCPKQPGGQLGSFEGWARVIRGAVVWAGLADPLETRHTANADDEALAVVRGILGGLREVDESGDGLTCREIVAALDDPSNADRFPTLREVVAEFASRRGMPDAQKLAYVFRKYRGRVAGGFRLESQKRHGGTSRWLVSQADGGDGGDGEDPFPDPQAQSQCVSPSASGDTHSLSSSIPSKASPPSPPSQPRTRPEHNVESVPTPARVVI